MTILRATVLPVLVSASLLWPTASAGQQYAIRDIYATPVAMYRDQLPASSTTTFETEVLTSDSATVIHVLEDSPPYRQLAANVSCHPGDEDGSTDNGQHNGNGKNCGKNDGKGNCHDDGEDEGKHLGEGRGIGGHSVGRSSSCVTVTVRTVTPIRVLVRARGNDTSGRGNLLKNHFKVLSNFAFAGNQARVDWAQNDVFEAPLASPVRFPGASTGTQLLLIRDPPLGLVAYDDNSGTGLGARLTAPIASSGAPAVSVRASYIVVASTGETTEGPTRLIQNDVLHRDSDGDGLGDELEVFQDPKGYLPTDPKLADSDGDGIGDGWELLGRSGERPQLLPRWGANPRHRDLFIEIDRDRSGPAPGITLAPVQVQALAARLAQWPNSELHNPDGMDGVSLHIDNGTASAGTDAYGDFGGSTDINDASDLQQAYLKYFAAERIGIFKYALAKPGCGQVVSLAGDRVTFASTCGDFAWKSLIFALSRSLGWGSSCCSYRRF